MSILTKKGSGPRQPHKFGTDIPSGARWVVGLHAVREVFRVRPQAVVRLLVRDDWSSRADLKELVELAQEHRKQPQVVADAQLERICGSHQGIAVAVEGGPVYKPADLDGPGPFIVMVLDQLTDSHNLGAVLRTAWLMGVKAVFVPEMRANHLSPAAAKVASGAAEHVPVVVESHLPGLLKDLKEKGFWVFGLAAEGARELWQLELPEKVVWAVGAEDKGLRSTVASACDELVRIFQVEKDASYNASVAAAIALAETRRQQKNP